MSRKTRPMMNRHFFYRLPRLSRAFGGDHPLELPMFSRFARSLLPLAILGAAITLAGSASADSPPAGLQAAAFRMPTRPFSALRADVARARTIDPRSFATVNQMIAQAPDANARARARKAPIALYLAKLGPSALMPMLEMLAIDPPKGVPADTAPLVRRDLIEAVGLLRDSRSLPVLSAILEDTSEDVETTRTTTEAIARLGTDDAATNLLNALAIAHDARARAIVAGMGECRQVAVAQALGERLRTTTDDATARAAARSLGRSGNAWVWPKMADRTNEARIRETAARALVTAFVQRTGEARYAAANAILVVDADVTPTLIAEARKTASPETMKALDGLTARLARNPIRAR